MRGMTYSQSNDSVPLSFYYASHQNLSIDTVASLSVSIPTSEIILSMAVAAHVRINPPGAVDLDATVSDMVLPAGVWPILIPENSIISLLKLTGSESGQASVIIPGR